MQFALPSLFYASLWLGVALLPFSTSPDEGGVVTYGLPFLVVTTIISSVLIYIYRFKSIDNVAVVFSTFYVFMIVIMTLFSPTFVQSSVRMLFNVMGYFIFLGIMVVSSIGRYSIDKIARICIFSCCILAVYFLVNFGLAIFAFGFETVIVERYVGGAMSLPWGASNTIAQVLLLAFVFYSVIHKGNKFDLVCLLMVSIGIVFTFSRSVTALMLLMYPFVFGVRLIGKSVICVFVLLFFGFVLADGFTSLDLSKYNEFIADRTNAEAIYTGNSRLDLMSNIIDYYFLNPLTPIGYYGSLTYFEYSAHNYWLTTLVEQSILGLIVSFLFLCYVAGKALLTSPKAGKSFMVILLGLMVEDPHFTQPYIILFWLLLGILVSSYRISSLTFRISTYNA